MRIHPKIELTDDERSDLVRRVQSWMTSFRIPKVILNRGLDGQQRYRLMGARNDGFTVYLVSVKPSPKLAEIQADPAISVLYYQYDSTTEESDQPVRFVAIHGTAELVMDVAGLRAFPGGPVEPLDDERLAEERFGIIVRPTQVRVEGFLPGPRYPIYLPVNAKS